MKTRMTWFFSALVLGLGVAVGTVLAMGTQPEDAWSQEMHPFLGCANSSSTSWVSQTVLTPGGGSESSLAVDSCGTPHVAYTYNGPCVGYAVLSGTTWITRALGCGANNPSITLDGTDNPHIAYHSFAHGNTVEYAVLSGTTWIKETVLVAGGSSEPSLAVDSSGTPHIAYTFNGPHVGYAVLSSTTWITSVVDWGANLASLALDSSGVPHIAYQHFAGGGRIGYAILSGITWMRETTPVSIDGRPSLALDSTDTPYIAYTGPNSQVGYAVLKDSTWVTETVDGEMMADPSLALDGFGNAHVAYCDVRPTPPNGAGAGLKYAYRAGGTWVVESVHVVECADPSLALDYSGNPHVSYDETTNHDLLYAYWAAPRATDSITTAGGSLTSSEDHTSYVFPQSVFTDAVVVIHTGRFPGSVPSSGDLVGIGHAFEVTVAYSDTGEPAAPASGQTYTVTVQYTEDERGVVDEDTLVLYYWDENQWMEEASSVVDPAVNTVTATPNHFSLWAVLGETRRVFLPLILNNY